MATRYVDTTLAEGTNTYDPETRSGTGGSDVAYKTLLAANAASSNGDTIYLRGGTDSVSTQVNVTATDLTIAPYNDEHFVISHSGANIPLKLTGTNNTIALGEGKITFQTSSASGGSPSALWLVGAGCSVTRDTDNPNKGRIIFDWPDGSAIAMGAAEAFTVDGAVFKDTYRVTRNIVTGGTLTLNNPLYLECGHWQNDGLITLVLNNPVIINGGKEGTTDREIIENVSATAVSITVNNPIFVGHGYQSSTAVPFQAAADSSITVNGGVVHNNIQNRNLSNSGTVTLNNVDDNKFIRFESRKHTHCYVSLCFWGNEMWGNATSNYDDYMAAAEPYGVKLVAFPDDHEGWAVGEINAMKAWVAAGNELGSTGLSGGDDWSNDDPIEISYVGANSNPRLVISNSGTTWQLITDSGTDATYDCSAGTDYQYLNHGVSPLGVVKVINALTDYVADVTSVGWDDAASRMMEDGTYPLSGTPTAIPVNRTRRMEIEIGGSTTLTVQKIGHTPTTFHIAGSALHSDVDTYCEANGWVATVGGDSTRGMDQQMSTASPFGFKRSLYHTETDSAFKGSDWDSLTAAQKEERIREGARRIATIGFVRGGYYPILFPHPVGSLGVWTGEELGWLIDEFVSLGVEIITCEEAAALVGTNSVVETYDYRPEIGIRWNTSSRKSNWR